MKRKKRKKKRAFVNIHLYTKHSGWSVGLLVGVFNTNTHTHTSFYNTRNCWFVSYLGIISIFVSTFVCISYLYIISVACRNKCACHCVYTHLLLYLFVSEWVTVCMPCFGMDSYFIIEIQCLCAQQQRPLTCKFNAVSSFWIKWCKPTNFLL